MILCNDTVRVVMGYLEPRCLKEFFKEARLDFGMKFIYDGRNWKIK